jgi:hypothetical protein
MSPEHGEQQVKLLLGRAASITGLLIVLLSTVSVFLIQSASVASISPGAIAFVLGVAGYFLGARRLGLVVVILGVLAIFLSLAATQGIIPGAPQDTQNLFQGPPGDPEP